jgi:hypothetical protein
MDVDTMNVGQLRELLARVISELHNGTMSARQANAITRTVNTRLASVAAELRAAKVTRDILRYDLTDE